MAPLDPGSPLGTLPVVNATSDDTTQPAPKLKVELVLDAAEAMALPSERFTTYYTVSLAEIDGTTHYAQKSYEDFALLHSKLAQMRDIHSLPAMPKKSFWRKTFNPTGAFMASRENVLAEILLFASSQSEAQPALREFVIDRKDGTRIASLQHDLVDDVGEPNVSVAAPGDLEATFGAAPKAPSLTPGSAATPHTPPPQVAPSPEPPTEAGEQSERITTFQSIPEDQLSHSQEILSPRTNSSTLTSMADTIPRTLAPVPVPVLAPESAPTSETLLEPTTGSAQALAETPLVPATETHTPEPWWDNDRWSHWPRILAGDFINSQIYGDPALIKKHEAGNVVCQMIICITGFVGSIYVSLDLFDTKYAIGVICICFGGFYVGMPYDLSDGLKRFGIPLGEMDDVFVWFIIVVGVALLVAAHLHNWE